MISEKIAKEKASKINLVLLDVDGVLTNGKIYFDDLGREYKAFNIKDGLGIKLLKQFNIDVGVITGRSSSIVEKRMNELGVTHLYQGQSNKQFAYDDIKNKLKITNEVIAYMGDDLPDLPLIRQAGLGITVPDAHDVIIGNADWKTVNIGGNGAVREACEFILNARGYCFSSNFDR